MILIWGLDNIQVNQPGRAPFLIYTQHQLQDDIALVHIANQKYVYI